MITATTRDLREHCAKLLDSVAKGEDVLIKRNGRTVARISHEYEPRRATRTVDWTKSAALTQDKSNWPDLGDLPLKILQESRESRW